MWFDNSSWIDLRGIIVWKTVKIYSLSLRDLLINLPSERLIPEAMDHFRKTFTLDD